MQLFTHSAPPGPGMSSLLRLGDSDKLNFTLQNIQQSVPYVSKLRAFCLIFLVFGELLLFFRGQKVPS